jgi:hypothetical protein
MRNGHQLATSDRFYPQADRSGQQDTIILPFSPLPAQSRQGFFVYFGGASSGAIAPKEDDR